MNVHHVECLDVFAQPARQGIRVLVSLAALAGEEDRRYSLVMDRAPHHYRQARISVGIGRSDQQLNSLVLESTAHLQNGLAGSPVSRSDRRNDMQDTHFILAG